MWPVTPMRQRRKTGGWRFKGDWEARAASSPVKQHTFQRNEKVLNWAFVDLTYISTAEMYVNLGTDNPSSALVVHERPLRNAKSADSGNPSPSRAKSHPGLRAQSLHGPKIAPTPTLVRRKSARSVTWDPPTRMESPRNARRARPARPGPKRKEDPGRADRGPPLTHAYPGRARLTSRPA